jgi:hypothetical protein
MPLLQKKTELFATVPDTVRQVCVPVHASHYYVVNYFHRSCLLSLFATTQATGKRQNIEVKLKLCKKGMSKEKYVNRERQEKTGEHKGERKVLKQI